MSDADALLRAILSDPADDLPRLMLADEIELAEPERAEFIRLQCELARLGSECRGGGEGWCGRLGGGGCTPCALRRRERELLAWFVAEDLSVGLGLPPHESLHTTDSGWICPGLGVELIPRRGFVAEVFLPLATFAGGGPCEVCRHWARGPGTFMDLGHPYCGACRGKGLTTGIAPALFAAQPVERVTLTDREPYWNGGGFCWYRASRDRPTWAPPDSAVLPNGFLVPRLASFISVGDATDWLSRRAVAWGRDLAGLPPPKQLKGGAK